MAVILESSDNSAENAAYDRVQKAREDAQLLINQKRHEFMQVSWFTQSHRSTHAVNYFFPLPQMEDQKGNAIHLPPQERNSLMMALAMHEKAKVELKKDNFTEALLLLLDADNEFSHCNSQLLESVDNYALLNLDIAWCYLCLKVCRRDGSRFPFMFPNLTFFFSHGNSRVLCSCQTPKNGCGSVN